jgi:peptidoglycan/xylan/chitin deacetylase (PgdA/CDA1 family)
MLVLPMPAAADTSGHVWPAGCLGAVSLSYDDGLDSRFDLAVPALERHGFLGTFFLTLDNIRHRLADWAALARRGHELANHAVTHPCDLTRFTPDGYRRVELQPMARWLRRVEPELAVRSFAYPCDVTDLGPGDANQQEARFDRLLSRTGIAVAHQ